MLDRQACILGALLAIASLALPAQASAPARLPPAAAEQAFAECGLVFLGQVVSVSKDPLGFDSHARVRVLEAWKGNPGRELAVSGQGGPTYPARIFKPGQRLLFYLERSLNGRQPGPISVNPRGEVHADSFTDRVVPEAEAGPELAVLRRKRRRPRSPAHAG
ncbi:MAG: hypothetical protein JWM80_4826 [Cyanobacteria bacterium RYN_339]|nr:hypothetical protein [Cyanobacteria bacterium RYN_339]